MAETVIEKRMRAPREAVIEYFTNPPLYFEAHSRYYKSYHVVAQADNVVTVDEEWEFGGRVSRFRHKIVLNLPESIEMEIIEGDGRGSRETIAFEDLGEYTKVIYRSDFRLGGLAGILLGRLVRQQMKKTLEEMAEEDRRFIEARVSSPY